MKNILVFIWKHILVIALILLVIGWLIDLQLPEPELISVNGTFVENELEKY